MLLDEEDIHKHFDYFNKAFQQFQISQYQVVVIADGVLSNLIWSLLLLIARKTISS